MKQSINTVVLLLTSAVVIGGRIMRAGERVEVTEDEAKDLLHRRRATVCEGFGIDNGDAQFTEGHADPVPGEVIGEVASPVSPIVEGEAKAPPAVIDVNSEAKPEKPASRTQRTRQNPADQPK